MKDNKKKISELRKDKRNLNKGTDLGNTLITNSFKEFGAGRSLLADKNLNIIAGNHAIDGAKEAGIEEVIIVPTNGKQLVVVQRTDVEIDSKIGRGLAIADNRTTQANLVFDNEELAAQIEEFELDTDVLGVDLSGAEGGGPFNFSEEDYDSDDASEAMETDNSKGGQDAGYEENTFPLAITVNKAQKIAWEKLKKDCGKPDSELLVLLMRFAKKNDIEFVTFLDNQ